MTKAIIYSLISILTFTLLGMIYILELNFDDRLLLSMTESIEPHSAIQTISDGIDHVASSSENTKEHVDDKSVIKTESTEPHAGIPAISDGIDREASSSVVTKEHADNKSNRIKPRHPSSYRDIIHKIAQAYSIEPSLVIALITVESNWNSKALSHRGAIGLMQLMPATAKAMGIVDPYNPTENIEGGIKYLSHLLDRFDGDITLAIAAYNAGPRRIAKFRGIPPIRETQKYVKRVLAIYNSDANPS